MSTQSTTMTQSRTQGKETLDTEMSNAPANLISTPKIRAPSLADPHPKLVTLRVGTSPAEAFTVHSEFLKHYSPYFARMLSPPYLEAEERIIDLPEVQPATFGIFVVWLYYRKLTEPLGQPANVNDLIHLWFLAELAEAPGLQNDVVRTLHAHPSKREMLSTQDFRPFYTDGTEKSLMHNFLVTSICRCLNQIAVPENVPKKMLVDAFAAMHKHRSRPDEKSLSRFLVKIPGKNGDYKEGDDDDEDTQVGTGI